MVVGPVMFGQMEGRSGACQIGSVLKGYLWSLGREIEHASFFCDSCTGNNRNLHVTAALAYGVKMCHFKTASINFLEPGPTQI